MDNAARVSRAIVRALNPVSVILFGSVAREGTGADLDFLIVTDGESTKGVDPYLLLHRSLGCHLRESAIDPFIISSSWCERYYRQGSPFLRLIAREGRPLYMRDAVREGQKQASDELEMADYLLRGGYYKGACYHAQQAVEKAIKAKLLGKGWELERIHSLERLVAVARDYRIRVGLTGQEIVFMDAMYRGRYPAEAGLLPMGDPSDSDAQRALRIARKVLGSGGSRK